MSKKNYNYLAITILAVLTLAWLHFADEKGPSDVDSGYRMVMGTFARIVAVAADRQTGQESVDAAFTQLVLVDELMSDYKPDSQLSIVNRQAYEKAIKVDASVFEVLKKSVEYSKLTGGAFDITVGPLVDLYHDAAEANTVPTEKQIEQARAKVGYDKLILDANESTVRFLVAGMRLDLGGIAKGYAIDKAAEAMIEAGALGGMVDVGGDIRCFGNAAGGKESWLIGLQDPNVEPDEFGSEEPIIVLKLNDNAIATSGDYRRFVLIGEKKFSHIIDTQTASGSDRLTSVTIIAPQAIDADALATSVSVLGTAKGLSLIESIADTEAILIRQKEGETIKTTGADKYLSQK